MFTNPVPGFSQRNIGIIYKQFVWYRWCCFPHFGEPSPRICHARAHAWSKPCLPLRSPCLFFYLEISRRERINFGWALRKVAKPPEKSGVFCFWFGAFLLGNRSKWNPTKTAKHRLDSVVQCCTSVYGWLFHHMTLTKHGWFLTTTFEQNHRWNLDVITNKWPLRTQTCSFCRTVCCFYMFLYV